GTTIELPQRPVRIASYLTQAAALWDFGIESIATFGWIAANLPDGDHIAWGNVDVAATPQISNIEGSVELEQLVAADPDLIVTWTWNKDDVANATNGSLPDQLDQVRQIASIIVLNQGDPTDIELGRVEELAIALGADLETQGIVESRTAFEAKVVEFGEVVAERSDISAIFASFGDPAVYYVASPGYVADVGFVQALGLNLANGYSADATQYCEEISSEQAMKYPSDIVYLDAYGVKNTLDQIQVEPVIDTHPAIASGQVGFWQRDFPMTYAGITEFLEAILTPLRTAEKVS
ncbi:MAG: hypothetical protein WKF81_09020, partial [Thermomicrobiales bacterium]